MSDDGRMSDLDPRLTFENFVVGPANRLASAAARRAADAPGSSYNPLFLYGASGLGKSHILIAMAHQAARRSDDTRAFYRTMEEFLEELASALEAGDRDGIRDRYRDLDILLLDDVQFLAGQPEAQEMLLRTLDVLTSAGRQIVLASDRPPAEIDGLDARLLSRFAGGLIVDIAPPEFETRVAIVRRKAEERGQTLLPGVAEALARHPFRNVRELGGGLNRVLAVQELEGREVGTDDLPDLFGATGGRSGGPVGDELEHLLAGIAGVLDGREAEEPWRRAVREAAEAAEAQGFTSIRMRGLLDDRHPPRDWEQRVARFHRDVERLSQLDEELDRLENPWPEAAASLLRDPDRVEEGEALLASVRERVRQFPALAPGPVLDELGSHFPQLPLKAAEQLVSAERPRYTPLFLWSDPPESARAVLAATGRSYRARETRTRMAVTSVADFAQDFIRALSEGVAGAWRERWWTLDLLLVHGVEDLSDTERAQDEFFHLFEALKRRGSRVMLVADRPPSRIGHIDDRLRSRFEGGLVLEAPARELPEEFGRVEFAAEGESPRATVWHGLTLAEGEAEAGGDAPAATGATPAATTGPAVRGDRSGAETAATAAAGSAVDTPGSEAPAEATAAGEDGEAESWHPDPERVVLVWPQLEERLVEGLD
jgi:chromosomal replication initiation ATPase DnaA